MKLSDKAKKAIQGASAKYGIPESYLIAIALIESQGNTKAVNRSTGAKGLFQFMPRTAMEMGLSDPHDEVKAADAAARYTRKNLDTLRAKGIYVDLNQYPVIGYLAHQQGASGIAEIVKAAKSGQQVSENRRRSMKANAGGDKTPEQYIRHWADRFEMKMAEAGLAAMCRARVIP